jgi:hypothetical protein
MSSFKKFMEAKPESIIVVPGNSIKGEIASKGK